MNTLTLISSPFQFPLGPLHGPYTMGSRRQGSQLISQHNSASWNPQQERKGAEWHLKEWTEENDSHLCPLTSYYAPRNTPREIHTLVRKEMCTKLFVPALLGIEKLRKL